MRDGDDVQAAFEEQCDSADRSRELCDIFGFDAGGNHAARRDRLRDVEAINRRNLLPSDTFIGSVWSVL